MHDSWFITTALLANCCYVRLRHKRGFVQELRGCFGLKDERTSYFQRERVGRGLCSVFSALWRAESAINME